MAELADAPDLGSGTERCGGSSPPFRTKARGQRPEIRDYWLLLDLERTLINVATYEDKWFEVWYTDGEDVIPTYLLVVTPNPNKSNHVLIVDPIQKNKVVFEADDYEAATDWLCEDEYTLASERQFPDDGWPLTSNLSSLTSNL